MTTQLSIVKIHSYCGGHFVLTGYGYGKWRYVCDGCGVVRYRKISMKGGSKMPFPKGSKHPGEVPGIPIMHKIDDFNGKDLLLKSTEVKPNEQYGDAVVLVCDTEDGTEVKILTFSEVIRGQLPALIDHLPLLIRPVNNGTYYTIY